MPFLSPSATTMLTVDIRHEKTSAITHNERVPKLAQLAVILLRAAFRLTLAGIHFRLGVRRVL